MATEKTVNILVTLASFATVIDDRLLRQIAAVSPKVRVKEVSGLVAAELKGNAAARDELDALLSKAEIIYGARPPQNVIARAPGLRWIQTTAAGAEQLLNDDIVRSPVVVTNYPHGVPIAEYVLQVMLMFAKKAPVCFRLKQAKSWEQLIPMSLRSKTVGIVGLGSIGREVARLSKAFGMRVIAIRKSVAHARNVNLLLSREQLPELLSASDFVVLAVPSTSETSALIGSKELGMMKSTAYLINVARGNVVDEAALIQALEKNRIAGAGLDVFAAEPLPADSKLWELPNVIFSPHIAGRMEDYNKHVTGFFCENLERYLNGKRLLNTVDKKKGY